MARNILIVLLVFSFCFLGFSVGRYTHMPPVGPNVSIAKEVPDFADAPEIERALTISIIASSNKLAKDMVKNLDKQDLSKDAYSTFMKAARGLSKGQGGNQEPDPNKIYNIPQGNAPFRGPKDAPVTIMEFSEFQCPFCSRAYTTIKELEKEYEGKVKVVFRSILLPRHDKAPLAHAAAYAARRQGNFWDMHDKIFENQKNLSEEAYLKYAQEMGLNMAQFKKDMHDPEISKEWAEDQAEASKHGVRSTPTFFINGIMVRGAKPKEEFKKVIDAALQKAQAGK